MSLFKIKFCLFWLLLFLLLFGTHFVSWRVEITCFKWFQMLWIYFIDSLRLIQLLSAFENLVWNQLFAYLVTSHLTSHVRTLNLIFLTELLLNLIIISLFAPIFPTLWYVLIKFNQFGSSVMGLWPYYVLIFVMMTSQLKIIFILFLLTTFCWLSV